MGENSIMKQIQVAATVRGARIFRNQTGVYKLEDGRWLSSGLAPGSSDLIGWSMVEITEEMVGKRLAVFTAIEVKSDKGVVSPEQQNFIDTVNRMGGFAFVARSVTDLKILDEQQDKLTHE